MNHKREAATVKAAAKHISGVTCKANSSLSIVHINHSYNVIRGDSRIASFLTEGKAIRFVVSL